MREKEEYKEQVVAVSAQQNECMGVERINTPMPALSS